ncbi:hypothetical protein [Alicyclobacillus sendaiensis]|uniref:hypothetical protein n=1 Tax=Alicyclobacillus sendaiensis TaxID=192387 RepID=UPI000B2F59C1|nr:hypothetical protein [Alicyclobacillus sendaiensis]
MNTIDSDDVLMEFCDKTGFEDPHPNDFPMFLEFLQHEYPDLVDAAWLIWKQWF